MNTIAQQNVKKSHTFWSEFGCNSKYSSFEGISFHQFPRENEKIVWKNKLGVEELVDRKRIWDTKIRMCKETLQKKKLQVCSKHFTEDNYFCPR